ncbi:MAG: gliding motility protein GldC [Lewinella sp.]|nr:gliding motility protein GldC [Lewinella sp.]
MAKPTALQTKEINLAVSLDGNKMPHKLAWSATDNPVGTAPQPAKAMLLSLFDEKSKEVIKIDLWTPELQIQEMDRLFYQTLRGLAETYFKATQNRELANSLQQFTFYFGQETGIIPKPDPES